MQTYNYRAIGKDGKEARGIIQASDEFAAAEKVRQTYPIITELTEVKEKNSTNILNMDIGGKLKLTPQQLSVMCSQFAIMLKSGIPVARSIELVASQNEDKKIRKMLTEVAEDVSHGSSVASAFEKEGDGAFPVTFIETIRAGELAGTIENSFAKMKIYYEKSFKTQEKLRQAMTYPIFVVAVAIVVLIVVMVMVIPTLADTFASMGGELPLMTRIMIAISNWFSKWWILLVVIILAAVIASRVYFSTPKGRLVKGKIDLKLPVLGKINTMNSAAQFADTMSVMLASGLTVNHAIEVTAKVLNNALISEDVASMQEQVEEGRSLGDCIMKTTYFPEQLKQMTSIGEESGELDATLETIGEYYDNEADHLTAQALNKLEPTMLVILAVFAGFIVISIYLPMFTMYNLF
jgi:type IV pilus assembly protein PilC